MHRTGLRSCDWKKKIENEGKKRLRLFWTKQKKLAIKVGFYNYD